METITWDAAIRAAWATLTAAVVAAFGPPFLVALGWLVALMTLDIASGLIANGKLQQLDPKVGWYGVRRKANTVILLFSLAILQQVAAYMSTPELANLPATAAVTAWFCVQEALSIVRNSALSGVQWPKALTTALGLWQQAQDGETQPQLPPDMPPRG